MPQKKLDEMNNDELNQREKTLKIAACMSITACLLFIVASIIMTIEKGFNAFTVLPITMLPLAIVYINALKKVQIEKQNRLL